MKALLFVAFFAKTDNNMTYQHRVFVVAMIATRFLESYCLQSRKFQLLQSITTTNVPEAINRWQRRQRRESHESSGRWLSFSSLSLHRLDEVDIMEHFVGGERYEFVPIPDAMKSTTVYVSNICEFAQDGDLSQLFQKVSKLFSVPACIARKPDTTSMQYGFVSFPSVEEKEVRGT
jgi:hypothetical protein